MRKKAERLRSKPEKVKTAVDRCCLRIRNRK